MLCVVHQNCRGSVSCSGWFGQGKDEPAPTPIIEEEDEELREVRRLEAILERRLELGGEAMREDGALYAALLGSCQCCPSCVMPVCACVCLHGP